VIVHLYWDESIRASHRSEDRVGGMRLGLFGHPPGTDSALPLMLSSWSLAVQLMYR
jgi:hypothetical protein